MEKHSGFDLLFETCLRHLYSVEKGSKETFTQLIEEALSSELKDLFDQHQKETTYQVTRIKEIFRRLEINPDSTTLEGLPSAGEKSKELLRLMLDMNFTDKSKGMDGILKEKDELVRHFKGTDANDLALLIGVIKIKHFEIGCYSPLCVMTKMLKEEEIHDLLRKSLDEEIEMEKRMLYFTKNKQLYAGV